MSRDLHATIDAVWRIEAAKIIGALARMVRDVGLAEELAQDALVAALEHWPLDGIRVPPPLCTVKTTLLPETGLAKASHTVTTKGCPMGTPAVPT